MQPRLNIAKSACEIIREEVRRLFTNKSSDALRNMPVREILTSKVVEHINGDWVIKDPSHDYIKEDASTIHFLIDVEPGKKEYITYTYRKEWN